MRWQYRVFRFKPPAVIKGADVDIAALESELNKLGAEGWEAVTSFERAVASGITNEIAIVMKRQA